MCGACGGAVLSGADRLLNSAYGRTIAAALANELAPRLAVRPWAIGWVVRTPSGGAGSPATSAELFARLAAGLPERPGGEASSPAGLLARLRQPAHRPVETDRATFPASEVLTAGGASPAPADRVLHHVFAAGLSAALRGVEEQVVLADAEGAWRLRCTPRH